MSELYFFLLLVISVCLAQDCEVKDPDNGYFQCSKTQDNTIECNLFCNPGYSPYPRSWTSCSPASRWTSPPSNMTCSPSVLLMAGSGLQSYIDSVELFSPALTCPTTSLPDLPVWSFGHSLDYVDGQVLMCGSKWESDMYTTCWTMKEDNTWEEAPDRLLHPRDSHTSAVVGSQLYLIGGYQDPTTTEVLDMTNPGGWSPGFSLAEDVEEGCSVTLSDGRVAVLGGWRSILLGLSHKHDGVRIYSMEGRVETLPHMTVERKWLGCGLFTRDGKEYLIATGGYQTQSSVIGPGVYWDTTEILQLGSGHWRTLDSRIPVAGSFKIVVLQGRIIGIGFDPDYSSKLDIVLEYNVESEEWVQLNMTTHDHLASNSGGITSVPAARFGCF